MAKKIKKVYKKSIIKLFKLWGTVLAFLIGIFGLKNYLHAQPDPPNVEYGMPYAVYQIKGKVINKVSKEAIPGIKVAIEKNSNIVSEVISDENGKYVIKIKTPGAVDLSVQLVCEDIDGELNGSFKNTEKKIKINKKEFVDDNKDKMDEGFGEKRIDVEMIQE